MDEEKPDEKPVRRGKMKMIWKARNQSRARRNAQSMSVNKPKGSKPKEKVASGVVSNQSMNEPAQMQVNFFVGIRQQQQMVEEERQRQRERELAIMREREMALIRRENRWEEDNLMEEDSHCLISGMMNLSINLKHEEKVQHNMPKSIINDRNYQFNLQEQMVNTRSRVLNTTNPIPSLQTENEELNPPWVCPISPVSRVPRNSPIAPKARTFKPNDPRAAIMKGRQPNYLQGYSISKNQP